MLTDEQLLLRKEGIGSSDIARILCFDKWEVWAEKTGKATNKPYTQAMRRGDALEPVIASLFCERFEIDNDSIQKGSTITDGWKLATPDYYVQLPDEAFCNILECKSSGYYYGWGREEFTDDIPRHVIIQVQWQMGIAKLINKTYVGAFAGNEFRVYVVNFDRQLFSFLEEIGYNFWHNYVLKDTPPNVDKSKSATEYLHRLYPNNKKCMLNQTKATIEIVDKLRDTKKLINRLSTEKNASENQLKAIIGDADGIEGLCTWKADKNGNRRFKLLKED